MDRFAGEPPLAIHPVARFGQAMVRLERRIYRDDRLNGSVYCVVGVGTAAAVGMVARRLLGAAPATALATSIAVAGRMLGREANAIGELLLVGDLDGARVRLPSLVGRSPTGLTESEISRAVVESVAENCVDAVVAPVFWALVGGAPLVLAHRAVNTLDAMVGHHSPRYERFGWASARLDDVANFMPARLAAMLVVALNPRSARAVATVVRRDAHQHPSPNGGVIESAFAAALGIRLGGDNRYGGVVESRGVLGDGRPAGPADIGRAVQLLDRITLGLATAGVMASMASVASVVTRRRGLA